MTLDRDTLLHEILSQPSAPFREGHVITRITRELEAAGIPYFQDSVGNIVLGAANKKEYLRLVRQVTEEPLRVFIAHMDHPGFHGVRWKSESELEIKWHGGSPTQHLEGAKVWIADSSGWVAFGQMKDAQLIPSGKSIDTAAIQITQKLLRSWDKGARFENPDRLYGGFHFRSAFWQEGDLLYTKAADDLVGTFAITSLALDLWSSKKTRDAPFLGLLTRAEEVGFIGAIGHFELGWLTQARRPILCVSLETSRTLPGAEIGKGPIVRLGDRFTVFDPGSLRVFSELAQSVLPEKHQKRIMDGGSCEASAAIVYGHPCVGISIPLGNYHNQSLEGGPDAAPPQGPAPEFVHTDDIAGLLTLCKALLKLKLPWAQPWLSKKKEFKASLKNYRPLLKTKP